MNKNQMPKGVLGDNYAERRNKQAELSFRYQVRGSAVIYAASKYLTIEVPSAGIHLLDMGAAEGKTLRYISQKIQLQRGVGIEYNRQLMSQAEGLPDHVTLMEGDVTNLKDIPDASFHVVTALALLEHLPSPALAIAEASRILRPGGLFVATSPVPFWDHVSVKLGLLDEDHHECDMYQSIFRGFFGRDVGLNLVKFTKFMWAPIGYLPYVGIQPDPAKALKYDLVIERLKIFNFLFVNQLAVAVKTV